MNHQSDRLIACEMLLNASGFRKVKQRKLDPLAQELLDYVNSPEYMQLIINEYKKTAETKSLDGHTNEK